ncbi:MAG: bifunctional oligoribonuclease/PAP phosphatase NrnA [Elusimicrobia bacterium]|nr:bifunctional oligoribonuclease/PAP phosphatase NrnA [Elusimicrobiota bacterium]
MKLKLEIPPADREPINRITEAFSKAKTAYITWHARPDGDAIGGGLALNHVLRNMGVKTDIISPTEPPGNLFFLNDIASIKTGLPHEKHDILVILDCSDTTRLEGIEKLLEQADLIINIDHHQLNHNFGDINYIRSDSSSVCEMITNIIIALDVDIEYELAQMIYTGILTDTNRFQEQNTTVRSHLIAAELIRELVSPVKIASLIYGNKELNTLKLTSRAIEAIRLSPSGKIGYIRVSPEMFFETETSNEDLEGIINYARNIKGVEVGILFRRIDNLNGIKVSFRSKGKVDVAEIARAFSGGGHHNAAGCFISGDLDTVINKVLRFTEEKTS